MLALALPYSEYLCSAARALTLSCGALVLHRYGLRVLDFHLFPTLHTVGLHFALLEHEISTGEYHESAAWSIGLINNVTFCYFT